MQTNNTISTVVIIIIQQGHTRGNEPPRPLRLCAAVSTITGVCVVHGDSWGAALLRDGVTLKQVQARKQVSLLVCLSRGVRVCVCERE